MQQLANSQGSSGSSMRRVRALMRGPGRQTLLLPTTLQMLHCTSPSSSRVRR
jgi:hypothetical protein